MCGNSTGSADLRGWAGGDLCPTCVAKCPDEGRPVRKSPHPSEDRIPLSGYPPGAAGRSRSAPGRHPSAAGSGRRNRRRSPAAFRPGRRRSRERAAAQQGTITRSSSSGETGRIPSRGSGIFQVPGFRSFSMEVIGYASICPRERHFGTHTRLFFVSASRIRGLVSTSEGMLTKQKMVSASRYSGIAVTARKTASLADLRYSGARDAARAFASVRIFFFISFSCG